MENNQTLSQADITAKFNKSFFAATTREGQDKSIKTFIQDLTNHGFILARHIQGPIKKGSDGWGLRKPDNRVQSDPYSAYNMR